MANAAGLAPQVIIMAPIPASPIKQAYQEFQARCRQEGVRLGIRRYQRPEWEELVDPDRLDRRCPRPPAPPRELTAEELELLEFVRAAKQRGIM